jgi:hypothetical protein
MAVTKEPFIIDGEIVAEKQTLTDSSTSGVINATERSTEPSAPASGDIYLDDGTNSASGNPQWRRYTGSAWEDIGGGVASTVSDLEFDNADLTAGVLTITGLKTIASIVDNAGDTIAFADSVNYGASNTTVDLSSFGTITGTWKVKFAQGYGETTGATFLSQTDTPSSYSGQSGKVVAVNTGETALEFTDAPSGDLPVTTLGTSGTVTIDRSVSDKFIIPEPTGAITLADSNFSDMKEAIVDINNGFGNISFPATWEWGAGNEAPVLTGDGVDRINIGHFLYGAEEKILAKHIHAYWNLMGNDANTLALYNCDTFPCSNSGAGRQSETTLDKSGYWALSGDSGKWGGCYEATVNSYTLTPAEFGVSLAYLNNHPTLTTMWAYVPSGVTGLQIVTQPIIMNFMIGSGNVLTFTTASETAVTGTVLNDEWFYIGVLDTGTVFKIYINGVLIKTTTNSYDFASWHGVSARVGVLIDEVRVQEVNPADYGATMDIQGNPWG